MTMEKKTASDMKAYLSTFEPEYPFKKGYVSHLIVNEKLTTAEICMKIKCMVQMAEPDKQVNEGGLKASVNEIKRNAAKKMNYTIQWADLVKFNQQPFIISETTTSQPVQKPCLQQSMELLNILTDRMRDKKTVEHLRAHLSVFEAGYPIQKGYIAQLLMVKHCLLPDVVREVRFLVQTAQPGKILDERSLVIDLNELKTFILDTTYYLTKEWPSLVALFLEPFPVTFKDLSVTPASQPKHKPRLKPRQSRKRSQASVCDTNSFVQTDTDVTEQPDIKPDPDYEEMIYIDTDVKPDIKPDPDYDSDTDLTVQFDIKLNPDFEETVSTVTEQPDVKPDPDYEEMAYTDTDVTMQPEIKPDPDYDTDTDVTLQPDIKPDPDYDISTDGRMVEKTDEHLRAHLSNFEAGYPVQKGYIARLLIVNGVCVRDVFREVRSIVQVAEPGKIINESTLDARLRVFQKLISRKQISLTKEWPLLTALFIQPFPLTFKTLPLTPASPSIELSQTSVCDTRIVTKDVMAEKADEHRRAHLSVFEAGYPVQNGYIAQQLLVYGRSLPDVLHEIRCIVQTAEPSKILSMGSLSDNLRRFYKLILSKRIQKSKEWPFLELFLEPFPVTFKNLLVTPDYLQPRRKPCLQRTQRTELSQTSVCDTSSTRNTDTDVTLQPDIKPGPDYDPFRVEISDVSLPISSHDTYACTDVEENKTGAYNNHSSVSVRENIDPKNMTENICYREDVRSETTKNTQTQKVKPVIDRPNTDLHQENSTKLLEQGLPTWEKTLKCQQNDLNIVVYSKQYLDDILADKLKTQSLDSQKSLQPSILQSLQPTFSQSVQPSDSQSLQSTVSQSLQPSDSQSLQPSDSQSVKPSVSQSLQSSVSQSVQSTVSQSLQSTVSQSLQPSVLQSLQLSVLQSVQSSVSQSLQPTVSQPLQPTVSQSLQPTASQSLQPTSSQSLHSTFSQSLQSSVSQSVQSSVSESLQPSVSQLYVCKFCRHEGFVLNSSLWKVRLAQRRILPNVCIICGHAFRLNKSLMKRRKYQTEKKAEKSAQLDDTFKICGTGFSKNSDLQVHTKTHTEEKPCKCDVCGTGFSKNSDLQIHTKTHTEEKPCKCDVCGTRFSKNSDLQIHTKTHTAEKPCKCDVCGCEFSRNSDLEIHRTIHKDVMSHQCDVYGCGFANSGGLKMHARTHTEKKPYLCDVCGHGYKSKSQLTMHNRIHTGEKPYKCDVCWTSFAYKLSLNLHTRIHSDERPYKCDVCEATFKHSSTLKGHKIIHTGEKPYECDICGFRVNRKDNLRLHRKIHT